ncbi:MAG: hypothetical protein AAF802_00570 [Planctomycetota bacterium]
MQVCAASVLLFAMLGEQRSRAALFYLPNLVIRGTEITPVESNGITGASYPPGIVLRMGRSYRMVVPMDVYQVPGGSALTVRTVCINGTFHIKPREARVIVMGNRVYACYDIYPGTVGRFMQGGTFTVRTINDADREFPKPTKE